MSEHYICIIPSNPRYIPDDKAKISAVETVEKKWGLKALEVTIDDIVTLRDCGLPSLTPATCSGPAAVGC